MCSVSVSVVVSVSDSVSVSVSASVSASASAFAVVSAAAAYLGDMEYIGAREDKVKSRVICSVCVNWDANLVEKGHTFAKRSL